MDEVELNKKKMITIKYEKIIYQLKINIEDFGRFIILHPNNPHIRTVRLYLDFSIKLLEIFEFNLKK